jgi:thiamine-phosphate pyrophosphorylase
MPAEFVYSQSMPFIFPPVYPILDASCIPQSDRAEFLRTLGSSLAEAGVTLLEYRNKTGSTAEILEDATILRAAMPRQNIKLILDDRVDLIAQTGFDGVHVDAGDASPRAARELLGPESIIGTFGGSEALVPGILAEPADYFSIGPVYATTTKQTSKPPIGPEGIRRLRQDAGLDPVLVAAGGITLAAAQAVLAAGATTVAVSAAIFNTPDPASELRRWIEMLRR